MHTSKLELSPELTMRFAGSHRAKLTSVSRFLPNVGKYIINVLNGKSNGEEKDTAWDWKKEGWDVREQSPDMPKLGAWTPKRELSKL